MIVFDPRVELTPTGFIKSRHLDDKASIATIYGAVAALVSEGRRPYQDTLIHIANYEEVGHGAAAGISADIVELVSVDMGRRCTRSAIKRIQCNHLRQRHLRAIRPRAKGAN